MIVTLDQLHAGDRGQIFSINSKNPTLFKKLMHLGFLPGMEVEVVQIFPSFLVQMGFTQIALDKNSCRQIQILLQKV